MKTLKLNHMPGGKVMAIITIILVVILIIAAIALFLAPHISVGFFAGITLLLAAGTCVWLAYKQFRPGFTEVIFLEEGIISQVLSEKSEMRIEDMKDIWITSLPLENNTFERYDPDNNPLRKNTLLLFGDIDAFDGATTFGMMGAPGMLYDTFEDDYATIYYRKNKGIDEFVDLYYRKIKDREKEENQ